MNAPTFRIGDRVLDPLNRRCTVVAVDGDDVTVCIGVYITSTARYPASCVTLLEAR